MTYWVILIVSIVLDGQPLVVVALPYKTIEACNVAMDAIPLMMDVEPDAAQCIVSGIPRASVRPKKRPEGILN